MQVIRGTAWDSARSPFVSAEVRWNSDGVIEEIQPTVPVGWMEMVVPGFIDEHIHGAGGVDWMDASPDALTTISGELVKDGLASDVLTTMSSSPESLRRTLTAAGELSSDLGAEMLGVHLEGPFLSRQYGGAQPKHRLRGVNREEIETLLDVSHGNVRISTLASELSGALELASWLARFWR